MKRVALLVVFLFTFLFPGVTLGQLVGFKADGSNHAGSAQIDLSLWYWLPPYDDIVGSWLAFLTPGETPSSPTMELPVSIHPWQGSLPPVGLSTDYMFNPVVPPAGPVCVSGSQVGEIIPSAGLGSTWGYAAMGYSRSPFMPFATILLPIGSLLIETEWVYVVGYTMSGTYGSTYRGHWLHL
jgi:hypothetical protein